MDTGSREDASKQKPASAAAIHGRFCMADFAGWRLPSRRCESQPALAATILRYNMDIRRAFVGRELIRAEE
jgi:hypothetical protein